MTDEPCIVWSEPQDPTSWGAEGPQSISREFFDLICMEERNRIIATIKGRRDFHVSFVNHSLDAGVEPSPSLYTAIAELNAILREIEK